MKIFNVSIDQMRILLLLKAIRSLDNDDDDGTHAQPRN